MFGFDDEDDIEHLDAVEMMKLLEKDPERGMDIVLDTAEEVMQTFRDSEVEIADLDSTGRNLWILCTVLIYIHREYVLKGVSPQAVILSSDKVH